MGDVKDQGHQAPSETLKDITTRVEEFNINHSPSQFDDGESYDEDEEGSENSLDEQEEDKPKSDIKISYFRGDRTFPVITIPDRKMQDLRRRWSDALIVRLPGRFVGYRAMCEQLERVWKPKGPMEVFSVGGDFFTVKLTSTDRSRVLTGCPWTILGSDLRVRRWTEEFFARTDEDIGMLWIRIPDLNVMFHDDEVLMAIVSSFGDLVMVDKKSLGRIVRVLVEVDMKKFAVSRFCLNGKWHDLEF
ncbi:hypothetical protein Dimus_039220 [Dionaea muscipula]